MTDESVKPCCQVVYFRSASALVPRFARMYRFQDYLKRQGLWGFEVWLRRVVDAPEAGQSKQVLCRPF